MRRSLVAIGVCTFVACMRSPGLDYLDGGSDGGSDGGVCCPRGAPSTGNCGPVAPGGWIPSTGGCKQKEGFAGRQVKPGFDEHNCEIWLDDGPCTYDGGETCTSPLDVTGYAPATMAPPRAPMKGACTSQDIDAFANCESTSPGACVADAGACGACLLSQMSDATWGPLVQNGGSFTWNSGGCVDLVLSQTALEPQSCGQRISDFLGCVAYDCVCPPLSVALEQCEQESALGACSTLANATAQAPCPMNPGPGSEADVCFRDDTIQDPAARQRDFVTRIATYFCGP
jgi:hypothetical protein